MRKYFRVLLLMVLFIVMAVYMAHDILVGFTLIEALIDVLTGFSVIIVGLLIVTISEWKLCPLLRENYSLIVPLITACFVSVFWGLLYHMLQYSGMKMSLLQQWRFFFEPAFDDIESLFVNVWTFTVFWLLLEVLVRCTRKDLNKTAFSHNNKVA